MYIPNEPTRISETQRDFIKWMMDKTGRSYHQTVRDCIDYSIMNTSWRPVSNCDPSTWVKAVSNEGSGNEVSSL